MEEIKRCHVSRKDDVFVATYQKSGTTWLQHILNQLLDEPQVCELWQKHNNRDTELYSCIDPLFSKYFAFIVSVLQGETSNINEACPWLEEETQAKVDDMKSPRIFKTHDKWEWVPKGEGVKYIYCYRNPKDVMCSYYNHMKNVFVGHYGYMGSMAEFYEDIFITPNRSENGFYFDHLACWFNQKDNPDILFVTFEDMVEDLKREISRISEFLKLDCGEEKIDRIVGSSMFDSMSKNAKCNYTWRDGDVKNPDAKFIRKGKVGGWVEELTKEQSDKMDELSRDLIEVPYGIKIRCSL